MGLARNESNKEFGHRMDSRGKFCNLHGDSHRSPAAGDIRSRNSSTDNGDATAESLCLKSDPILGTIPFILNSVETPEPAHLDNDIILWKFLSGLLVMWERISNSS